MELVYDISTEKNNAAGVLLMAFLTPLFVIIQWLQLHALQRRSAAMPSCHGSTKKLFQIHQDCSLLPVHFFSPGIGGHERHSPDPCIPDGKWRVQDANPHVGQDLVGTRPTPPGAISVFTGIRQTKNHCQILWRKGLFSLPFPPCSPPLTDIA